MIELMAVNIRNEHEATRWLRGAIRVAKWYGLRPIGYIGLREDEWRVSIAVRPSDREAFERHRIVIVFDAMRAGG